MAILASPHGKLLQHLPPTRALDEAGAGAGAAPSSSLKPAEGSFCKSQLRAVCSPPAGRRPRALLADREVETAAAAAAMGAKDTSLESTMEHRAWVAAGAGAVLGALAKAWAAAAESGAVGEAAAVAGFACGYVLADLGTGVFHWGVDNYGDARTPVFGSQIDAFQGHHQRPWTITKREFANNIHAVAKPIAFALAPFLMLPGNAGVDAFLASFLGSVMLCQQFHAWSHCKRSQLPGIVVALQDRGVLLSRKMHGAHHRSPYDINYCIVSGVWNPVLNRTNFFGKMERVIHGWTGARPRSWAGTTPEWMQETSYFEDGTEIEAVASSDS